MHILRVNTPELVQIRGMLDKIVEKENIVIDEESKEYLLRFSNNSIRTIITNLEKIYILGKPVNLEMCKTICTDISFQQFENYLELLKISNVAGAVKIFYDIHDYGYSVIDILDYFFTFIKQTELLTEDDKYQMIPILCKYITIFHSVHEDIIELALFTQNIHVIFISK